jgi:hypothetical protein
MEEKIATIEKYIAGGTAGAIESLIQSFPPTSIMYGFLKGGAETLDETKRERILEFSSFLQENMNIFDETFFKNKVFTNYFYKTFECYIRQINEEKLGLIKNTFTDYILNCDNDISNQENFEIERFYLVINSISLNTIKYIKIICEIVPIYFELEMYLHEEEKYRDKTMGWAEYCRDDWSYLTKYTKQYIHDEFDPNSKKVAERYCYKPETDIDNELLNKIYSLKKIEENKHTESIAELISLGILIPRVEGGGTIGGGGGNFEANLTNFGFKFIKILNT